ncbi:histidine kinase [Streptomyces sp. 1114.5]|uniref:sensor histidine kinase n=1 Tax=Streptomyces sp. 1114.5 TaxID=1938830 RepID=UPI000EB1D06E|nr:histidine kinase [Streptomyces sp. 1114.5]RKT20110.1 histidine kinase [Streptomyces sp. 1114.5]
MAAESARRARRRPRSGPAERQLALAGLCAAVCLVAGGLWVGYVVSHLGAPGITVPAHHLAVLGSGLAAVAGGVLLHAHRPGVQLGWVLLVYGAAQIIPLAAQTPVWVEVGDPGVVGAVVVLVSAGYAVSGPLWHAFPLWLPYGTLPSRRWWYAIGAVAVWILPQACYYVYQPTVFGRPNPLAGSTVASRLRTFDDRLHATQLIVFAVLTVLVILVPLARTRGVSRRRRQNVLIGLGVYLLWDFAELGYYFDGQSTAAFIAFTFASALWTLTLAAVVVRDGSWRLDLAARRVLVGLLVATGLVVVFVLVACVLSTMLMPGRRGAGTLLLIAVVFLLAAGLPRGVQWASGVVDRWYYGSRAQPYQVLRSLAGRVSQTVDPQEVPAVLCATVSDELRLPGVALTVSTRGGERPLAAVGERSGSGEGFALVHRGAEIGRLTVAPRPGQLTLDESDRDILRSLADQAAPAVASLRLTEDLRASREQIVAAREEERRQLRRDIHDGLGPMLAGLRLRLQGAAAVDDPAQFSGALERVADDLASAVREVRRITDRLGPTALGDYGLSRALDRLAETFSGADLTVTARLQPDPLPDLPAAVEVAVYRITAEALNNVLRHARARSATVCVRVEAEQLELLVEDDGQGPGPGDPARPGVGLRSMSERAAEIGGSCTVDALGRGTRVHAVLPRRPACG